MKSNAAGTGAVMAIPPADIAKRTPQLPVLWGEIPVPKKAWS